MSRFAALDLTALPAPSSVMDLDYDAILEARLVELEARLKDAMSPTQAAETMALARNIAASPMRYLNEAAAARELYLTNRINEAVRSVFLATARGGDLDLIGANRGVVRKIIGTDVANPIYEADAVFRARIQLAIEAATVHGTTGAYAYAALQADDRVSDVGVYDSVSGAGLGVNLGEVRVVVLSNEASGIASQGVLDAVYQAVGANDVRTLGDTVSVVAADRVDYPISATLYVASPVALGGVYDLAVAAAEGFALNHARIGRQIYRSSIAAALAVDGVVDVDVHDPPANVIVGPGQASRCSGIVIQVSVVAGG